MFHFYRVIAEVFRCPCRATWVRMKLMSLIRCRI